MARGKEDGALEEGQEEQVPGAVTGAEDPRPLNDDGEYQEPIENDLNTPGEENPEEEPAEGEDEE